jgi:hypothetical protein
LRVFQEVLAQIYATLYDYPCLRTCAGLHAYIEGCVRVAWGLSVQTPPYTIQYDARTFDSDVHTRFHTSTPGALDVQCFLWPALVEVPGGPCVFNALVNT